MERFPRVEYPCTKCPHSQSCVYRDCPKWRTWFKCEWRVIQEVAKRIKDRRNNSK